MPVACRLTDVAMGHGSFPPTKSITSSSNVIIEGLGALRQGDSLQPHASPDPSPPHPRTCAEGSQNVFVNSKPLVRLGDSISCGGFMITGASTVIVN